MADNLCESADDIKYKNDVKYLYKKTCILFSEKYCNWSAAMDLRRTDIKQQNKNVKLTFVFEHVNKYTMETKSKTNVLEWYNLFCLSTKYNLLYVLFIMYMNVSANIVSWPP